MSSDPRVPLDDTFLAHAAMRRAAPPRAPVVYLVRSGETHKIGYTTYLPGRMSALRQSHPELEPVHQIQCADVQQAKDLERFLHMRFRAKQVGTTEWFHLTAKDLHYIEGIQNPADVGIRISHDSASFDVRMEVRRTLIECSLSSRIERLRNLDDVQRLLVSLADEILDPRETESNETRSLPTLSLVEPGIESQEWMRLIDVPVGIRPPNGTRPVGHKKCRCGAWFKIGAQFYYHRNQCEAVHSRPPRTGAQWSPR